MFFRKKIPQSNISSGNLRRRFHHLLIAKRKENIGQTRFSRPKHKALRPTPSPALLVLRKSLIFIIIGGLIAGGIYTALFSSFFTITKVSVEKNGNAVAGSSLAPFLDKIKGKNILFINSDQLTYEIEQTFKNEVLLSRIKKSYPHKIIINVEEYPAICNFAVKTPAKTQKFVLNQIGYAIFENIEQKELPTLFLQTPKEFPPKSVAIEKEKMTFIADSFRKFIDLFGLKVPSAEWKKTERELHLKTEKGFYVWLDMTADLDEQLQKLKRSLPKLDIYRQPLEYVDLRIAGGESEKVIFKRRK